MSDTDVQPASPAPEAHEPAPARGGRHVAHPSPKEYFRIALVLLVITAMEVSTYYVKPPRSILIPALLLFTLIKFSLVVMWFMHLKFDSRTYSRFFVMGIAFAITLYGVVLLLFGAFTG